MTVLSGVSFDKYNKIITIKAPATEVTIQDLYDTIREWEDDPHNMEVAKICTASGKEDLGGGVLVGITLKLLDWKLKFEDRAGPDYILCNVTGGNLVAVDANNQFVNPIEPAAYVTVTKTSSASATIAELEIANLQRYIESQRKHSAFGDTYYWNPIDGDDNNTGDLPERAVKTFSQAHSLCTDGNHDVIFLLATDPSGVTTIDEQLSFTKDFISLRGSGRDTLIKPSATTGDTISISAIGVSISGIRVETADSGTTQNCISINSGGDNAHLEGMWIRNARQHGVVIDNAKYVEVLDCVIEHNTNGDGVEIKGSNGKEALIKNCFIWDNNVGICCEDGANENVFENNMVHNNVLAIKFTANSSDNYIKASNTFANNTTLIDDKGTHNYFEIVEQRKETSDVCWDELTSDHTTSGSTSKTLIDIYSNIGSTTVTPKSIAQVIEQGA